MPDNAVPAVTFESVSRHFGEVRAVDGVSFVVADGEFFSMLGPSGSGKTTCLRLIAGFDRPSAGRILIHGEATDGVPPYERDVNTVFQDYALFPHMSVEDNVAYGLMVKKVEKAERRRRAQEMLDLVKLAALAGRKPAQLSGGQRQRVALARALINHPRVLLLDEPLGALDLKLREEMQVELKAIQRQVGITFVYVTHDQAEALAMSDRLAVFNHGRIEQIGAPAEVYEHPETAFVAGFVGISNLLEGEVARAICGTADAFSIRPEKIRIVDHAAAVPGGCVSASGRIDDITYQGAISRYTVALDLGGSLIVTAQNLETTVADAASASGRTVRLVWRRDHNQPVGAGDGAT
ncbi:MAG: ABC transporter ATP-binding protein [Alphaproteobacteria bacterium]